MTDQPAGRGPKPVIGLLGGVGAGKSTVAAELAGLGCAVIDADAVGHELLADPEVKRELHRLWGDGVLDEAGEVDRSAVAERVFDDPDALAALNATMHPRMRRRMLERVERMRADPDVAAIVLDAALLLETDWQELCTDFVFVRADDQQRAERTRKSRGWSPANWARREKSQKALDIKAARAEYVIDNRSCLSCLREQVRTLFHEIVG
ncbi:MAG: dephospho-CoA kinase [Planctomycetota bacterium]|jgi:dephospho-CoA kinase